MELDSAKVFKALSSCAFNNLDSLLHLITPKDVGRSDFVKGEILKSIKKTGKTKLDLSAEGSYKPGQGCNIDQEILLLSIDIAKNFKTFNDTFINLDLAKHNWVKMEYYERYFITNGCRLVLGIPEIMVEDEEITENEVYEILRILSKSDYITNGIIACENGRYVISGGPLGMRIKAL
jgi:hypothetical protein